jgi:hypothetical protein
MPARQRRYYPVRQLMVKSSIKLRESFEARAHAQRQKSKASVDRLGGQIGEVRENHLCGRPRCQIRKRISDRNPLCSGCVVPHSAYGDES